LADGARVAYLDTSALVKLVVAEPQTAALRDALAGWSRRATSALAEVELLRAAARVGVVAAATRVLGEISLIEVDAAVLRRAAHVPPPSLRSLDAIHLASALALGDTLGTVLTYDARLADAARVHGLEVRAPA